MSKSEETLRKFTSFNKFHREKDELIMTMSLECKMKLDEAILGILQENKALKQRLNYLASTRDCDEEFEL